MIKLRDILKEIKITPNILPKDIQSKLEEAQFFFNDGLLGSTQGGNYYDSILDDISGYDLNEFNEEAFNTWYDNFSIDSFSDAVFDEEEMEYSGIDVNIIKTIKPGFYSVGNIREDYMGACEITEDHTVILYAAPTLMGDYGNEILPIFGINSGGQIVTLLSKDKVKEKLRQNIEDSII